MKYGVVKQIFITRFRCISVTLFIHCH